MVQAWVVVLRARPNRPKCVELHLRQYTLLKVKRNKVLVDLIRSRTSKYYECPRSVQHGVAMLLGRCPLNSFATKRPGASRWHLAVILRSIAALTAPDGCQTHDGVQWATRRAEVPRGSV